MAENPVLLLVQADPILADRTGRRAIAAKTLSGIRAFCRRWPGEVVVSAPVQRIDTLADSTLHQQIDSAQLPFDVLTDLDPVGAAGRCTPAVVLALHAPHNYGLLAWDPHRTVYTVENGARQRLRIESMQDRTLIGRARIAAGHARRLPAFRSSLREAAGLQCNGYAVWESVRSSARSSVLFFDHRITDAELHINPPARPLERGLLRLGFSGRHIAIKGPRYAVDLASTLRAEGLDVDLTVFGDGALRRELEDRAVDGVRFTGDLPFDEEWVPRVRSGVDVMVLPYPQGDPAGTYMESFALGVPVLGFANDVFAPLVRRHAVGWSVPVGDQRRLVGEARRLLDDPHDVEEKSANAFAFATQHSMEHEFEARVRHLRDVAQV